MNINIVSTNSHDTLGNHLSKRAWSFSRNEEDEIETEKIIGLDLPVSEVPSAVMEIESSIIEREIIASMRDHVMWARSSRVDDPIEFGVHNSLKGSTDLMVNVNRIKMEMEAMKCSGERQDEYRMLMPLTALTKYTVVLNLRSIIKLCNYFKKISTTVSCSIRSVIFEEAYLELKEVVFELVDGVDEEKIDDYVSSFKFINVLPHFHDSISSMSGGFITISATVPFSLRTHLIRHRMVQVNDSLHSLILSSDFNNFDLTTPVEMNISSSIEFWKKIIETRSCWLTHYGIWRPIIKEVSMFIPIDKEMLPCDGCGKKCPYAKDNEARLEMKDPNPPCPIYSSESKFKSKMYEQVEKDSRHEFWNSKIGELK